jgi:exocyst complex component 3
MMAEDLGIEAKETAVREVAKLLPLPELLQSIASIKADYIARQQVTAFRSNSSFLFQFFYESYFS